MKTLKRCLVRVDNRLVHGQILESWVPFLRASRIIVVNDEVMGDIFRESIIRMAVPKEIEVFVCGIDEFAGNRLGSAGKAADEKETIVLFGGIDDVLRAYRLGVRFNSLNVGNVYDKDGKNRKIGTHLCLSDGEIDDLMMLVRLGVDVEIRSVPRDRPESFAEAVRRIR